MYLHKKILIYDIFINILQNYKVYIHCKLSSRYSQQLELPRRNKGRSKIVIRIVLKTDDQVPALLDRRPIRLNLDQGLDDRFPECELCVVVGHLEVHRADDAHARAAPVVNVTLEPAFEQQKRDRVVSDAGLDLKIKF